MDDQTLILVSIPIIVIQLGLMIFNFINMSKKSKTKYLNKPIWIVLLLIFSYISNIAYILLEGTSDDNDSD